MKNNYLAKVTMTLAEVEVAFSKLTMTFDKANTSLGIANHGI